LKPECLKREQEIDLLRKEDEEEHALMGGAVQEIAEKSEAVYEEYKRALATF